MLIITHINLVESRSQGVTVGGTQSGSMNQHIIETSLCNNVTPAPSSSSSHSSAVTSNAVRRRRRVSPIRDQYVTINFTDHAYYFAVPSKSDCFRTLRRSEGCCAIAFDTTSKWDSSLHTPRTVGYFTLIHSC